MNQAYDELHAEQAAIGELSPQLREKYETNEGFQKRVQDLIQKNTQFLSEHPGDFFLPAIEERARRKEREQRTKIIRTLGLSGFGLAAAALFIVFILPIQMATSGGLASSDGDVTRIKGLEPQLQVFRYRPGVEGGYEVLKPNDQVKTADRLQVSFNPAGFNYGAIFSVDGRGLITLHFPSHYGASSAIQEQGSLVLPFAYELDDAPLYERFILVLSQNTIDIRNLAGEIQDQVQNRSWIQNGSLNLSNNYTVVYLPLRK